MFERFAVAFPTGDKLEIESGALDSITCDDTENIRLLPQYDENAFHA